MLQNKLIALDLDGTLLNKKNLIPNSTVQAVQQASQFNKITIATGRTFYSAKYFAKQLQLDIPLIACNGAIIKKMLTDKVIYRKPLSAEVISFIVSLCQQENIYYHAYSEDFIYLVNKEELTAKDGDTNLAPCKMVNSLLDLPKNCLLKFTIMGAPEVMFNIATIVKNNTDAHVIFIKDSHLEIIENGATKAVALEHLAQELEITQSNVIACGDGENDLEMIKWAGIGAVVANASIKLKDIADVIASKERSAGVEEILKSL